MRRLREAGDRETDADVLLGLVAAHLKRELEVEELLKGEAPPGLNLRLHRLRKVHLADAPGDRAQLLLFSKGLGQRVFEAARIELDGGPRRLPHRSLGDAFGEGVDGDDTGEV